MLKSNTKTLVILSLSLLLSACAHFVTPAGQSANDQSLSWAQRKQQLQHVNTWRIRGAVAIKTSQEAFTASLNWRQHGLSHYKIYLFGPLGMGAVNLIGTPAKVTLQADNKTYSARSAGQLLHQQLGWELPVRSLYYWVRGLPAPGAASQVRFDKFHHLISLNQQGWHVRYVQYTGVGRYDLPSKVYLNNHYMSAKLVISSWTL